MPESQSKTPKLSQEQLNNLVQYVIKRKGNKSPKSMIARYGRYSSNYSPTQKPPYNTDSLDRFEDTFRSDGVVQRAIMKKTQMTMGKHGKVILDTTEEFDDEDQRKAAILKVQNNAAYQEARKQIQKLNIKPEVNFHNNVTSAVIQCKVYGRAALEIINEDGTSSYSQALPNPGYANPGYEASTSTPPALTEPIEIEPITKPLPIALHLCNSKRLGRVEVETKPNTWKFLGVHYLDINAPVGGPASMNDVLYADEIMYFANKDYHISPGALYYGLSDLEPVIDGSETKRIFKQEDLKEIAKSNWAPFLLLKFANPSITTDQMQEVIDGIQPGLPYGTRQDIAEQVIQMNGELEKIPDVIDFLNMESIRDIGIPTYLIGYEQIANYANSQQILLALKEIELDWERTWLSEIIDRQWLNRYFYQILGFTEDDAPDVKLKYEFTDISFETTLDKVNAALPLFDRKLYSGEKVLKIADAEDEIDEYKIREQEAIRDRELRQELEIRRVDMEENLAKYQTATTPRMRTAKLDAYDAITKAANELGT